MSQEVLQIPEKRTEAKGKGERGRYSHLSVEFQRTARRVKEALLSEQFNEIEENIRMGKTGELFRKIKDTTGHFMQSGT